MNVELDPFQIQLFIKCLTINNLYILALQAFNGKLEILSCPSKLKMNVNFQTSPIFEYM